MLRTTLGYDQELPWGVRGTAEMVYSQTQKDVFYTNAGKVQDGNVTLDGRPHYKSISSAPHDAYLITNTDKGHELNGVLKLERPNWHGLSLSAFYAYQNAQSAFDGGSSIAHSNFRFFPNSGDIFTPDVERSTYEIEHRINLTTSYSFHTGSVGHTVGLYWNVQSGRPYSLMFGNDVNGDGDSNDLMYIPGSSDAIILQDSHGNVIDYSVLADFLQQAGIDPTAGRIIKRNESTEPWSHLLDFHYDLELPIKMSNT